MTEEIKNTLWRVGNDIGTDFEIILYDCIIKLEARIAELEAPKSCSSCNDNSQCYTYRTLEEEATYILSCNSYKPKDIK